MKVYLGTDAVLTGFDKGPIGELGTAPVDKGPAALQHKKNVVSLGDRVESGLNCSCCLIDPTPAEPFYDSAEEDLWKRAYGGLQAISEAALKIDPEPLLFSCWDGDQQMEVFFERSLKVGELVRGRWIFHDPDTKQRFDISPTLIRVMSSEA
ncbi:hypothetical protein [Pontivivens ytuae]|uniref:Uncharacterized protein n=1 Tax=Pontivivens ytuae TaxID=2789856 RepID=A0A7S9LUV4_9RHOB|nr:hypothetical protein [Pontivivens ytuae]QPH55534.1 hypothetical protein I0K15_07310 [Pontivivens ytuae]